MVEDKVHDVPGSPPARLKEWNREEKYEMIILLQGKIKSMETKVVITKKTKETSMQEYKNSAALALAKQMQFTQNATYLTHKDAAA